MNVSTPPRIATWLLKWLGCSANNDVILGDLTEQYQHRPRRVWFWKQALIAIVSGFYEEAGANKLRMLGAIFLGWGTWVAFDLLVTLLFVAVLKQRSLLGFYLVALGRWMLSANAGGVISGRVTALVGGQHPRVAVLGYALTVTIAYVARVMYLSFFAGLQFRDLLEPVTFPLAFLHLAAIFVGGLWGTSSRASDGKEHA